MSKNRQSEQVAAAYMIDPETGFSFDIYERQITEAQFVLGKYVETVVAIAKQLDEMVEHSRQIGTKPPEIFNAVTIDILDEALLIVDKPITYEAYILDGRDNKPVTIGSGTKPVGAIVRFDSLRLSATHDDELGIVPQAEIVEYQPGSRPSVYNSLVFNPNEQRIALMEIDTPQIQIS